jgi:hypothetical protein
MSRPYPPPILLLLIHGLHLPISYVHNGQVIDALLFYLRLAHSADVRWELAEHSEYTAMVQINGCDVFLFPFPCLLGCCLTSA